MRPVLPLLIGLCLGFAPAPVYRERPKADDLELMQGAWVMDHAHRKGVREVVTGEAVWSIKGDRIDTTLDGKKGSTSFITLHVGAAPRAIDFRDERGGATFAPGRYRVEGDTLTVCIAEERPPDLSGFAPSNCVWVFKRMKR